MTNDLLRDIRLAVWVVVSMLFVISIILIEHDWAVTHNQVYALCVDHPTIAACKDWKP